MNEELNILISEMDKIIKALSDFGEGAGELTLAERDDLNKLFHEKLNQAVKLKQIPFSFRSETSIIVTH
jgi:hypothetical protein